MSGTDQTAVSNAPTTPTASAGFHVRIGLRVSHTATAPTAAKTAMTM